MQSLLSVPRVWDTSQQAVFNRRAAAQEGEKSEKGYSFPMLAMKVLSLVIYYNRKSLFAKKRVKKKPCNSSLSVCFQYYIDNNVSVVYNVYVVTSH